MPAARSAPAASRDETYAQRHSRLLLGLAGLAAVSVVFAALVIFSRDGEPAPDRDPTAPVTAAGQALVLGAADAPTRVVVYEDFSSPQSREFDIASRDFLGIVAGQGEVVVEYRPVSLGRSEYAARALGAWGAVLREGTPEQALSFHARLFDAQSAPGEPGAELAALAREAGVSDLAVLEAVTKPFPSFVAAVEEEARTAALTRVPTVVLDGRPLPTGDPTELADRLQRLILEKGAVQ